MGDKPTLGNSLAIIAREFGTGAVMRMGDAPPVQTDWIPSGAITLDAALGGGYPRGRVVEIFGPEASGKTTLLLHLLANAQSVGLTCAFVDAEHALDVDYARALGVDVDALLVAQPDYGEQALEITDQLISSTEVGVVVVDSVAALTPRAELEGQMGDQFVGLQPRMMGQALRKLVAKVNNTNTLLVFTNQNRSKVGVLYGNPETQPGGRALKYFASQRLDVRRIAEGSDEHQNHVKVKVVKNKVAVPFKTAEFDIVFGQGISREGSVLDMAVVIGVVQRRGPYYYLDDAKLGQGRQQVCEFLKDNPETLEKLEQACRQ